MSSVLSLGTCRMSMDSRFSSDTCNFVHREEPKYKTQPMIFYIGFFTVYTDCE